MPLVSRTFDQLIDFTRTSAATYVDASGRIVPTAASRNLLTFTQEFDNAAWVKNDTTITANAATAPDGTLTADKLVENTVNAEHRAARIETLVAGTYTLSCYVKAAERGFFVFRENINGSTVDTFFNLNTGVVASTGAGRTSSIVSAGNGWYRCAVTATSTGGSATLGFDISDNGARIVYAGTTGFGLFLWGAQLEAVPDANFVLGSELAVNGTLDTDTAWTKGTGWTISGGRANSNAASGFEAISQSKPELVEGRAYRVSFEITSYTSGTVSLAVGTNGGVAINSGNKNAVGVYTFVGTFPAGATKQVYARQEGGFVGSIDNISVKEITGTTGMPTDYTRNYGGLFPPRFDYDPVTLAPRGLLIEEQRTNLQIYSNDPTQTATGWADNHGLASVTLNSIASPDGTVNGVKLTEDTSNGIHRISSGAISVTAQAYTMSVYIKAGTRRYVSVGFGFQNNRVIWDTQNNTFGAVIAGSVTYSAINAGNGWWRISVTATATVGNMAPSVILYDGSETYTGDGTSFVYVYGIQQEAGAFATSYIPTVASQVTRTADVAAITGANFSQWYNQAEGTLLVEGSTFALGAAGLSRGFAGLSNGTIAESSAIYNLGSSNLIKAEMIDDLASQAAFTATIASQPLKVAFAYALNNSNMALNGVAQTTDTACTVPTVNRLVIGSVWAAGDYPINGHIRSIRYYPTRLSNAQLQALTA